MTGRLRLAHANAPIARSAMSSVASLEVKQGTEAMIITDPTVAIIEETFGRHLAPITSLGRFGLKGRARRAASSANPFTSQAYAEAGLMPAVHRAGTSSSTQLSATQRRKAPLR
jgi:hypothetical protein